MAARRSITHPRRGVARRVRPCRDASRGGSCPKRATDLGGGSLANRDGHRRSRSESRLLGCGGLGDLRRADIAAVRGSRILDRRARRDVNRANRPRSGGLRSVTPLLPESLQPLPGCRTLRPRREPRHAGARSRDLRKPAASENVVECYALQRVPTIAQRQHRKGAYQGELARIAWEVGYRRELAKYRTKRCYAGGPFDLHPCSKLWP
jgi:hypothetical protein